MSRLELLAMILCFSGIYALVFAWIGDLYCYERPDGVTIQQWQAKVGRQYKLAWAILILSAICAVAACGN